MKMSNVNSIQVHVQPTQNPRYNGMDVFNCLETIFTFESECEFTDRDSVFVLRSRSARE